MRFLAAVLLRSHPHYPAAIARLPRPPEALFSCGATSLLERELVAIVGARAARRAGVDAAARLAEDLAAGGVSVVSGGAIGVDAAAHEGCLRGGAGTVVVLGNGIDCPYPERNRSLFRRCIEGGGLLLSPFPAGTPPRRSHFPQRNALIAVLARVVVVVEAGLSSGALQTASWARKLGVSVAAVPGSPGTGALIARGAVAVETAAQVSALLAGALASPVVRSEVLLDDDQRCLLALLREEAIAAPFDHWVNRAGIGPARAAMALLRLELEGWVSLAPGGRYEALVDPATPTRR
ncbi:MAG: DNA-protecting protein DprA [Proteobacteria bacterium]|nr:DNA-protecting protein DprA [Pseudomonadota bacterium]